MFVRSRSGEWRRWAAVLVVGTGLWLFLRVTGLAVSLIPGFDDAAREWEDAVAFGGSALAGLAMVLALTAVLLLIHRLERTPNARRAARAGLLVAIVPAAAVVAMGDQAGLSGLGVIRAATMAAGVIGASVLIHRLTAARASPG